MKLMRCVVLACLAITLGSRGAEAQVPKPGSMPAGLISANAYPSLQAALDANPGKMVFVPNGEHTISQAILINKDHAGLYGPGKIIQTDPRQQVVAINANHVRLYDVTLTRPEGTSATVSALTAGRCENLTLNGVRVINNRAPAGAINVDLCSALQIVNCLVQNYATLGVEDRTADPNSGYAFLCIDGTGIQEVGCKGVLIQGNRVIRDEYLPNEDSANRHNLGKFTKKNATRGRFASPEWWAAERTKNWHQGAAITINGSEVSDCIQVLDNYVLNAAQAFDIQSDHVTMAGNITEDCCLGMKAMHGSRNTMVLQNQFYKSDISSVLLQSGAASHAAGESTRPGQGAQANVDGGSIVAHNITSDFGYGSSNWIWGNERYPYEFNTGQLPGNPPLTDVLFLGNILFDPGNASAGANPAGRPKYQFALGIFPDTAEGIKGPVNVRAAGNLLHTGAAGVVNQKVEY